MLDYSVLLLQLWLEGQTIWEGARSRSSILIYDNGFGFDFLLVGLKISLGLIFNFSHSHGSHSHTAKPPYDVLYLVSLTWWTAFEVGSGWLVCAGLAALSYQELPLVSVPSITTITTNLPDLLLERLPRFSSSPYRGSWSGLFSRFIDDREGSSPAISARQLIVDLLRRYLLVSAGAIWDC